VGCGVLGLQGKTRENGQRGTYHQGMGVTLDRRLRALETVCWGRYRLGLLLVTYVFLTEDMVA